MITRLLVANRGEIARRVFRTCRQAGIGTVAVYSDPDGAAPHATEADAAVLLPGASPAQTYLNGPAIVAAAIRTGAGAVHPGYGFLAEDAGFARAVLAAGLTWVGPPPQAIEAMGLKINSKRLAAEAGVPVLAQLDLAAGTAGEFPLLIKASAGGGGRGMRIVRSAAELPAALESAQREAAAAFGDGAVFGEPLLTGARHVEVQVLADSRGTIWALTERDCSVQRRYQKVIEETPSPAVSPALRERLLDAARAVTAAVGYRGAGTAEFLLGPDGRFYFLEFNTRLQVEHPVTECLHGIDLVALQLEIAEGFTLPPEPPPASGHAIEARLYAEDPADGYRPSAGPVLAFAVPGVDARFAVPPSRLRTGSGQAAGLRLDSGIEPGSQVSSHYDAMLAKVISWAPGRAAATRRLAAGLAGAVFHGPASNRDLLVSVLRSGEFRDGGADTSMLDRIDLAGTQPDEQACRLSALAAAVAAAAEARQLVPRGGPALGGWRNVPSQPQRRAYLGPAGPVEAAYWWTRTGIVVAEWPAPAEPNVLDFGPGQVTLETGGVTRRFAVARYPEATWVDSALGAIRLIPAERLPAPQPAEQAGSLLAPLPGSVIRVAAAPGEPVDAGQVVLVLEAMKMEHPVTAPAAGVLGELRVAEGDQVTAGDLLAVITEQSAAQPAAEQSPAERPASPPPAAPPAAEQQPAAGQQRPADQQRPAGEQRPAGQQPAAGQRPADQLAAAERQPAAEQEQASRD
ncbi:MAG TPA: biotin carboxylase N-terminal domain-containing protein [Streptosporangiaceae bacterium]